MKTKKANQHKKTNQAGFSFPWGDPQKMAEVMGSCCRGEAAIDCCSMMRSMMEHWMAPSAKKPTETRSEPKENG